MSERTKTTPDVAALLRRVIEEGAEDVDGDWRIVMNGAKSFTDGIGDDRIIEVVRTTIAGMRGALDYLQRILDEDPQTLRYARDNLHSTE